MELHIETTRSGPNHSSVGLYGMVIDGNFSKVSPPPSQDTEDLTIDLGDGRTFVGGTINYHTYAGDTWDIEDGALRQFKVDAIFDEYLILEQDGTPVTGEALGPDTQYVRPLPTGDAAGLERHNLFLEGPGLEPTGTYVIIVDGEVVSTDDPGELVFDLGDGFTAISGHIAGGNDELDIAGTVEYVATGGDPIDVTLNGQPATWDEVVSRTGGTGTLPGDLEPEPECQGDADCPEGQVCEGGSCVEATEPDPGGDGSDTVTLALLAAAGVAGGMLYRRRQQ